MIQLDTKNKSCVQWYYSTQRVSTACPIKFLEAKSDLTARLRIQLDTKSKNCLFSNTAPHKEWHLLLVQWYCSTQRVATACLMILLDSKSNNITAYSMILLDTKSCNCLSNDTARLQTATTVCPVILLNTKGDNITACPIILVYTKHGSFAGPMIQLDTKSNNGLSNDTARYKEWQQIVQWYS